MTVCEALLQGQWVQLAVNPAVKDPVLRGLLFWWREGDWETKDWNTESLVESVRSPGHRVCPT